MKFSTSLLYAAALVGFATATPSPQEDAPTTAVTATPTGTAAAEGTITSLPSVAIPDPTASPSAAAEALLEWVSSASEVTSAAATATAEPTAIAKVRRQARPPSNCFNCIRIINNAAPCASDAFSRGDLNLLGQCGVSPSDFCGCNNCLSFRFDDLCRPILTPTASPAVSTSCTTFTVEATPTPTPGRPSRPSRPTRDGRRGGN